MMKNFSERWSCNRPATIKLYLDLIHSFNRQGHKQKNIYESQSKTNLLNRNKHYKIRVTISFKKIADKKFSTLPHKCVHNFVKQSHSWSVQTSKQRRGAQQVTRWPAILQDKRIVPSANKLCVEWTSENSTCCAGWGMLTLTKIAKATVLDELCSVLQ